MLRSRTLVVIGLLLMLFGALDPLEGCLFILVGSGTAALGAHLATGRHRALLTWAFALVAAGVAALLVLSAIGGIGGKSGRSLWWALLLLPYAAGWLMAVFGVVLWLFEGPPTRANEGEPASS